MSNYLSGAMARRRTEPLSVTELTARIRSLLEGQFTEVIVQGELSGWAPSPSGHSYFAIKDDGALLSCVMWRSSLTRLRQSPRDGDQVECRGRISLYEKRGQYQLMVDSISRKGEGDLWQKFQQLKEKLDREGLFAADRKRPLPQFPLRVGVVTAPAGAAIRDILTVMERRAPSLSVLIWPTRVQGDRAGLEIAEGVRRLGASGMVDVLIVGRGGGSAEDLWEFNDETLARAIVACPVPVVSAVGHEIDTSISDFVADLRAATPSIAAELVTAGYHGLRQQVDTAMARQRRAVESRLREWRHRTAGLVQSHALRRPELMLREYIQRTDDALARLPRAIETRMERMRHSTQRLSAALEGHNPDLILKKGYAIVRRAKDGQVLTQAEKLKRNLLVDIELHDGARRAVITDTSADDLFG